MDWLTCEARSDHLHAIRWVGNEASHAPSLSRDDVLDGLEITEAVLDELFVQKGTDWNLSSVRSSPESAPDPPRRPDDATARTRHLRSPTRVHSLESSPYGPPLTLLHIQVSRWSTLRPCNPRQSFAVPLPQKSELRR
ncbi:MAG: DUF4145 domain-containing protein [bacterium]|nr:DUF4145 domain-containing protein [bacterium]